jgi:uncharacterized protein
MLLHKSTFRIAQTLPRAFMPRLRCSSTLASPEIPKKLLLLQYEYDAATPDELALRRAPLRAAHLAYAANYPCLQLGGAFSEPPMGGLLVFGGASKSHVEGFAKADPYVVGKLVRSYSIREWVVVLERNPDDSASSSASSKF